MKLKKIFTHGALTGLLVLPSLAQAGTMERVSVAADGSQANFGQSQTTKAMSDDGRYVAFTGPASLVSGGLAGTDVFVRDRLLGTTEVVSIAGDGSRGNASSFRGSVSADGRYVTFISTASNLVEGDTNGQNDIFVHDRQTGNTVRVSVSSDGAQANNSSDCPKLSGNGRFVVFSSNATNLVADDNNSANDIFVHDLQTGVTERISMASDGNPSNSLCNYPAISADGRFVAFVSNASNLVEGDTNGQHDVFVRDRLNNSTERVSVASDGTEADSWSYWPSLSGDGRYVAFYSLAGNLVNGDTNGVFDVFLHDRESGITDRISVSPEGVEANGYSALPILSPDGRFVAFSSTAGNLVADDTNGTWDVFVHDRENGGVERVSVASDGSEGNSYSQWSSLSADGRIVSFMSTASNLVADDTNATWDVFAHDRALVNQAPIADAGSDQVVECGGAVTAAFLDGSASIDPDGDVLSYLWAGSFGSGSSESFWADFSLGSHSVVLTVADGNGGTASDDVTVTIVDQTPPVLNAPADVVLEAVSANGASYSLTPSANDLCGSVNISVTPELAEYPLGTTLVQIRATDSSGNSSDALVTVQVQDTIAPVVAVPADVTVEATDVLTEVELGLAAATDAVGVVSLTSDAPEAFPVGTTVVAWTAVDAAGNIGTATQTVTVADTKAPSFVLTVLKKVLRHHDKKMVHVATVSQVADLLDPEPVVDIMIASNQAEDGKGAGKKTADWEIRQVGDIWEIWLRAERSGREGDRLYSYTVTAADFSGNSKSLNGKTIVPHDNGKHRAVHAKVRGKKK